MQTTIWGILFNLSSWNIDTILKTISLVFVAVGGAYSLIQLANAVKTKRTETLYSIALRYLNDKDIQEAMQIVSYNQSMWYSLSPDYPFFQEDEEIKIDKMLTFFSFICYLKYSKSLSNKEFSFFQYDIASVGEKAQTQLYLWDLWKISQLTHSSHCYRYLVKELIEEGIVDANIFTDIFSTNEEYEKKYIDAHAKILKRTKSDQEVEEIINKDKEYISYRKNEVIRHQSNQRKKARISFSIFDKMNQIQKRKRLIKSLMKME